MEKITIATFLWGNWPKGCLYVNNLANMFQRHLTIPHEIVCFTDFPVPCKKVTYVEIPRDILIWEGNFKKFWAYSPFNGLSGRIVLIDLDMIITGDMNEMLSYDGQWCGIRAMHQDRMHIGGGLVSFEHESCLWFWDAVVRNIQRLTFRYRGKERLVYRDYFGYNRADTWQELYPGKIVSFKRDLIYGRKRLPPGTSVVAFHGKPRPHQVNHLPLMQKHWR